MDLTDIVFDWVSANDLEDAIRIEQEGFPSDEAASIETFRHRHSQAGNLFLGAYTRCASDKRRLIGYVCATLSPDKKLMHSSMSTHVPGAASVCIHSICVDKESRRGGLGMALMKEYIARLEKACAEGEAYERILLITHEDLREFYEKAGYEWLGRSEVKHGSRPWFEMRKVLHKSAGEDLASAHASDQNTSGQQQKLAAIMEVLQRESGSRGQRPSRSLSEFTGGIADVISPGERDGISVNKHDLICPRPGCGSIILKKEVASWVERSSVQLDPPNAPKHTLLPDLPATPATMHWWLVTPSPMAFENIGFTRPVKSRSTTEPQIKLLACAECDLGPLGWTAVGSTEFWLAQSYSDLQMSLPKLTSVSTQTLSLLLERQRLQALPLIGSSDTHIQQIVKNLTQLRTGILELERNEGRTEAVTLLRSQFDRMRGMLGDEGQVESLDADQSPASMPTTTILNESGTTSDSFLLRSSKDFASSTTYTPYKDDPEEPDPSVMLQVQRQMMDEQDEHLDRLSHSINRQHHISLQINDELDVHTGLLEELDTEMDRTDSRLNSARRRLDKVAKVARENSSTVIIALLILVLLVLIIIFKT